MLFLIVEAAEWEGIQIWGHELENSDTPPALISAIGVEPINCSHLAGHRALVKALTYLFGIAVKTCRAI